MRIVLLIFLLGIGGESIKAQTTTFFKTLTLPSANAIDFTTDGQYIITGSGGLNAYLLKVDTAGNTMWVKYYSHIHGYSSAAVQETYDQGFIMAGAAGEPDTIGENLADVFVQKTNSLGDTSWTFHWNAASGDYAADVLQTADSNYLVGGILDAAINFGSRVAFLLKLNQQGDTLWSKTYEPSTYIGSITSVSDGGFILTGGYAGSMYIMKINDVGDTLWTKKDDLGFQYSGAVNIIELADSNFIIVGNYYDLDINIFIAKMDKQGNLLWSKQYGGSKNDYAAAIDITNDNGFIVTGGTYSYATGPFTNTDIWLLRLDENGDTLWTRSYGDSKNNVGNDVKSCPDGGFMVIGSTGLYNNGFLMKTDSLGNTPFFTSTENFKENEKRVKVYPNPATDKVMIEMNTALLASKIEISIHDSLGRQLKTLHQSLQGGVGIFQIDVSKLNAGIYFLKVGTGNDFITKKMVKQ